MAITQGFHVVTLCFYLITFSQFSFIISKPTGFSIKLIHRDSPESPMYPGNLTQVERLERLVRSSKVRGEYLENFSRLNAKLNPDDVIRPLVLPESRGEYIVEVKIGSQESLQYLLMDTGSGLIWSQCNPCRSCFKQALPMYDTRESNTYRILGCDHFLCSAGSRPMYRCVDNQCTYTAGYADGTTSSGIASLERLSFEVGALDNVIFGCSNNNPEEPLDPDGTTSGILGLSFAPESLSSQLFRTPIVEPQFSYCMMPFVGVQQSAGALRFGADIPRISGNVLTTPFVQSAPNQYYYLHLKDVSVGFERIGFAPDTFAIREDNLGGCLIDSGTVVSRIDVDTIGINAYRIVMGTFQRYYDTKSVQRMEESPIRGLDYCYHTPPGFKDFATMTFHFEGADYIVDGNYMHYIDDQKAYFCIMLVPGNGFTILGAWQQQNMRIIHNTNIMALQFYRANCVDDKP